MNGKIIAVTPAPKVRYFSAQYDTIHKVNLLSYAVDWPANAVLHGKWSLFRSEHIIGLVFQRKQEEQLLGPMQSATRIIQIPHVGKTFQIEELSDIAVEPDSTLRLPES